MWPRKTRWNYCKTRRSEPTLGETPLISQLLLESEGSSVRLWNYINFTEPRPRVETGWMTWGYKSGVPKANRFLWRSPASVKSPSLAVPLDKYWSINTYQRKKGETRVLTFLLLLLCCDRSIPVISHS